MTTSSLVDAGVPLRAGAQCGTPRPKKNRASLAFANHAWAIEKRARLPDAPKPSRADYRKFMSERARQFKNMTPADQVPHRMSALHFSLGIANDEQLEPEEPQ